MDDNRELDPQVELDEESAFAQDAEAYLKQRDGIDAPPDKPDDAAPKQTPETPADDAGVSASGGEEVPDGGEPDGGQDDPDKSGEPQAAQPEQPDKGQPPAQPEKPLSQDDIEAMRQQLTKWQNDFRALHSKVAPTQRENAELRKKLDELAKKVDEAERKSAKFEDFSKRYPEDSEAIQEVLNPLRQELESTKAKLVEVEQRASQTQFESYVGFQRSMLDQAVPDWQQIRESTEFNDWFSNQPPRIQALIESYDAQDNIYLIQSFQRDYAMALQHDEASKAEKAKERQTQQLRRPAPTTRSPTPTGTVTPESEEDAYAAAAAEYLANNR